MKKLNYKTLLTGLMPALILASCSTTKHLAEGEVLYVGTPTTKTRAAEILRYVFFERYNAKDYDTIREI